MSNLRREEERLDEADKQFYITAGYLLAIFQHAERLFEVAEIGEKRQIISLLLSNLQLDGKKLYFTLKKPFANVLSHANGSVWLGMIDLICNPNKYSIALSKFNHKLAKIMLEQYNLLPQMEFSP